MSGSSPMPLLIKFFLFSQCLFIAIKSFSQDQNSLVAQQLHKPFIIREDIADNNIATANNGLLQIDSIAHTNTLASHFCKAYSKSMQNIETQIQNINSGAKAFIQKFETGFANYFLTPYYSFQNGNALTGSVWKCYYSSKNAKPWQLVLLGVNAHINGDFWHVLVDNFSEPEIRHYKKEMLTLQPSIVKVYDDVFDTIRSESSYLRFINFVTFGSAKKFGERVFYKWRKRSINLAIMYYQNPQKFKRKLVIVNRKKQNIDKQILSHSSSTAN
jgi:hypothetical protein